jgi:transcriptional regulator with XRE-family HTH domain
MRESFSPYSKQFAISLSVSKNLQQIDRLAEWLRQKRQESGWSYPKIAERSGGLVSQGTAANVVNKRYDTVDTRTVKGLAKAFEISEQELWDIINGVVDLKKSSLEKRELGLPSSLWRLIDSEARRGGRPWNSFVEAVFMGYFGADVNIDLDRLKEIRKTDAVIIPLPEDGTGEIPFTKESTDAQTKRRSVKPLSKKIGKI